jgi:predicted DNA-binding transcriptional regulator YafY
MSETVLRQWAMLRELPRAPRKISVQQLLSRLESASFKTTDRTIQRDLIYLSGIFPIICDSAKPKGWAWSESAVSIELPGMDVHTALTLAIIEKSVTQLLPTNTYRHMLPWFQQAQQIIANAPAKISNWKNRLSVVDRKMLFLAPKVDRAVQETVYDGILNGQQIEVTYRAITSESIPRTYPVSPLGLVIRDRLIYMVCTMKDYVEPRLLALHRSLSAKILETKSKQIPGLKIDDIAFQVLSIRKNEKKIKLQLVVSPLIAKYLQESPLSETQTVKTFEESNYLVSADVQDSEQLRSWVRSLGCDAVVLKPIYLQNHFNDESIKLVARYKKLLS